MLSIAVLAQDVWAFPGDVFDVAMYSVTLPVTLVLPTSSDFRLVRSIDAEDVPNDVLAVSARRTPPLRSPEDTRVDSGARSWRRQVARLVLSRELHLPSTHTLLLEEGSRACSSSRLFFTGTGRLETQSLQGLRLRWVDADILGPGEFARLVRGRNVFLLPGILWAGQSGGLVEQTDIGPWMEFLWSLQVVPSVSGLVVTDASSWGPSVNEIVETIVARLARVRVAGLAELFSEPVPELPRLNLVRNWDHSTEMIPGTRLALISSSVANGGRVPILVGGALDSPCEIRRYHLVQYLIDRFRFQRYLEIGCEGDRTIASVRVASRIGLIQRQGGLIE